MEANKSNRIFYFDALRALAIFCVICIHVYCEIQGGIMHDYALIPSYKWFYAQIMGNCFRIGVPLFLMLSGALLLGRNESLKEFLHKRLPRIVVPFIFWGFVLSVILIILAYVFGYEGFIFIKSFDLYGISRFIFRAYLAKSSSFEPYWFFWTIFGIYLLMPVINKLFKNPDFEKMEYFLVIWLITCLITYTLKISIPFGLDYFAGPIGFVVLGYYLRCTERKLLNNPRFAILLILLSAVSMILLSWCLSSTKMTYNFDRYTILVAIEAIGVFLLFKNFDKFNLKLNFIRNPDSIIHKLISSLAKHSYGIYLTHASLILIILGAIPNFSQHVNLFTVSMLVMALVVPWFIMVVLDKIPVVNRLIGSK